MRNAAPLALALTAWIAAPAPAGPPGALGIAAPQVTAGSPAPLSRTGRATRPVPHGVQAIRPGTIRLPTVSGVTLDIGGQSFGITSQCTVTVGANPTWSTGGFAIGADPGSVRFDPRTGRYYRISPPRDPALSSHYEPDNFEPEQEAASAPAPIPPFDLAMQLLNARRYADAAKTLEGILKKDAEDANARLWLGVAQVFDKKFEDGAARIVGARRNDPAGKPLSFAHLPGITQDILRNTQNALANRARIADSADCYASAAIFAQARARPTEAAELVKKAKQAGLDPVFAGQLLQSVEASAK